MDIIQTIYEHFGLDELTKDVLTQQKPNILGIVNYSDDNLYEIKINSLKLNKNTFSFDVEFNFSKIVFTKSDDYETTQKIIQTKKDFVDVVQIKDEYNKDLKLILSKNLKEFLIKNKLIKVEEKQIKNNWIFKF